MPTPDDAPVTVTALTLSTLLCVSSAMRDYAREVTSEQQCKALDQAIREADTALMRVREETR